MSELIDTFEDISYNCIKGKKRIYHKKNIGCSAEHKDLVRGVEDDLR